VNYWVDIGRGDYQRDSATERHVRWCPVRWCAVTAAEAEKRLLKKLQTVKGDMVTCSLISDWVTILCNFDVYFDKNFEDQNFKSFFCFSTTLSSATSLIGTGPVLDGSIPGPDQSVSCTL